MSNLFVSRTAEFSPDRRYRYALRIVWDEAKPLASFVGLNPSTADEFDDDPTLRRCRDFAGRWGCGGLLMLNLFAFRSTAPVALYLRVRNGDDAVGPENSFDSLARRLESVAGPRIAAWGRHGKLLDRGRWAGQILDRLDYLALNNDGSPCHPLYLPSHLQPQPFNYGHDPDEPEAA